MIYGDISEHKKVHDAFRKALGKNYGIKELGTWDCTTHDIPLEHKNNICVREDKIQPLLDIGYKVCKQKCKSCPKAQYIRFADFEIAPNRAFYERKTASDFVASRRNRLYSQMNRMDTFIESRKGLILEGQPKKVQLQDSVWQGAKDKINSFNSMSPLQQAIKIGGSENWTLSFIRELKSRDMEFVQTWDLNETIQFLKQCDNGYDRVPKLRFIPKRYPELPIEQNILAVFKGIGKVRSEQILKTHPRIAQQIKQLIIDVKRVKFKRKV